MKWITTIGMLIASTLLFAGNKNDATSVYDHSFFSDSAKKQITLASFVSTNKKVNTSNYSLKEINLMVREGKPATFSLGLSHGGRNINAFYFPGISEQRALVIAGVHGSELSAVEVAYRLIDQLQNGVRPYYAVVIVSSLFPDNAVRAINDPAQIGSTANIGRYSQFSSVDPNRQMPSPGKAYDEESGLDHLGRVIETENQSLLQLIQAFKPQRIINVHAIRNTDYGGVYADPRTDHKGIALGYSSDSDLAISIAKYIHHRGGNVDGNKLDKNPTALYYKDPAPAPAGFAQERNYMGSSLNGNRGRGISLGTWASTAIANEKHAWKNRDAMRILTMEYPGYKRPVDYSKPSEQLFQQKQVELYASAINKIFLGNYYTEDQTSGFAIK